MRDYEGTRRIPSITLLPSISYFLSSPLLSLTLFFPFSERPVEKMDLPIMGNRYEHGGCLYIHSNISDLCAGK